MLGTLVFGAIPVIQYFRYGTATATSSAGLDDLNGATKFETFRISTCKRSASKSSLANGNVDTAAGNCAAASESSAALITAYGAITGKMGAVTAYGAITGKMGAGPAAGGGVGGVGVERSGAAGYGVDMNGGTGGGRSMAAPPYSSRNYE